MDNSKKERIEQEINNLVSSIRSDVKKSSAGEAVLADTSASKQATNRITLIVLTLVIGSLIGLAYSYFLQTYGDMKQYSLPTDNVDWSPSEYNESTNAIAVEIDATKLQATPPAEQPLISTE